MSALIKTVRTLVLSALFAVPAVRARQAIAQPPMAWTDTSAAQGSAACVAVDASGLITVAVTDSPGGATGDRILVTRYWPDGLKAWTTVLDPSAGHDRAAAIRVDAEGRTYLLGTTGVDSQNMGQTYFTAKLDTDGGVLWSAQDGAYPARAAALAVDGSRNVVVTGMAYRRWYTAKYDAAGARQWADQRYSPYVDGSAANSLDVDEAGNVYVTGAAYDHTTTDTDMALVKYLASGGVDWEQLYGWPQEPYPR